MMRGTGERGLGEELLRIGQLIRWIGGVLIG